MNDEQWTGAAAAWAFVAALIVGVVLLTGAAPWLWAALLLLD